MTGFILGANSRAQLNGVHPLLARAVQGAINLTTVDFAVLEGVRTLERQHVLVATGMSKTLNSMHLRQPDGFGHAVDLVPWIKGKPSWDWPAIFEVAEAMRRASAAVGATIRWGGVWDRTLDQLKPGSAELKAAEQAYCARHPGPDFVDGPHYELRPAAVLKA